MGRPVTQPHRPYTSVSSDLPREICLQENSPSTVGGVIRRYTIKTFEVLRSIPGLTVTYSLWATRSVHHSHTCIQIDRFRYLVSHEDKGALGLLLTYVVGSPGRS